jgi:hypothetical protein
MFGHAIVLLLVVAGIVGVVLGVMKMALLR